MTTYLKWDTPEEAWQSGLALNDGYTFAEYAQFLEMENDGLSDAMSYEGFRIDNGKSLCVLRDRYLNRANCLTRLLLTLMDDGRAADQPRATENIIVELERCKKVTAEVDSFFERKRKDEEALRASVLNQIHTLETQGATPDPRQNPDVSEAKNSVLSPTDFVESHDKNCLQEPICSIGTPSSTQTPSQDISTGLGCVGGSKRANGLTTTDLEGDEFDTKYVHDQYSMDLSTVRRHTHTALKEAGWEDREKWKKSPGPPIELTTISELGKGRIAVVRFSSETKPHGWRYRAIKAGADS